MSSGKETTEYRVAVLYIYIMYDYSTISRQNFACKQFNIFVFEFYWISFYRNTTLTCIVFRTLVYCTQSTSTSISTIRSQNETCVCQLLFCDFLMHSVFQYFLTLILLVPYTHSEMHIIQKCQLIVHLHTHTHPIVKKEYYSTTVFPRMGRKYIDYIHISIYST